MDDKHDVKPTPARRPEKSPRRPQKPTPARALGGPEVRPSTSVAVQPPSGPAPETPPEVAERTLEVDGSTWRARVLGRSGRSAGGAPPLLLLGFWEGAGEAHQQREATVVARTLAELSPSRLAEALARSCAPPTSDPRKPFFEGAGQGRRGGSARRDSSP